MNKGIKTFVLELPGPPSSYCNCKIICSSLEIDHAMPKKILKEIKNRNKRLEALNDPNNLYRCCLSKNRKKSDSILNEKNPGNPFNGIISRSLLYMNHEYSLNFNSKFVSLWKGYSLMFPPYEFEKKRNLEIGSYYGKFNPFIFQHDSSYNKF